MYFFSYPKIYHNMNLIFCVSCILLAGLSYVTHASESYVNTDIIPCQSIFTHNFCESRLRGDNEPELLNSYTSLAVTIIPLVSGFPTDPQFYNVACMLSINGLASFYYHYKLNWFGKQADEITMILATFFGTSGLINLYTSSITDRNKLNRYNVVTMCLFLVSNTMIQFDPLFPSIFGIYVGAPLMLIYNIAQKHNVSYIPYLLISLIGTISWVISEHHCTEYTKYGHPVWHVLFPLGFYRILLNYDKLKLQIDSPRSL
jgi:hypothetical protein